MSEANATNYIKSPDGGFLLKDDQVNIEKDELGRPVIDLSTAPPSVSEETSGKVLTNDGEKVGWSDGYGVTLNFLPVETPALSNFVFDNFFNGAPCVYSSTKPNNYYSFFLDRFDLQRIDGAQVTVYGQLFVDFHLSNDKVNLCVLSSGVTSSGILKHEIYYCFGADNTTGYRFKSGSDILQNTEVESFALTSSSNQIFIVCSGTNQAFISEVIDDSTSLVKYTAVTLPDTAKWSDVVRAHESPMSGADYFYIVGKNYNGWLTSYDGNNFTKYSTDFPMGDLVAIDDATGFEDSTVVTISTKYPIATYGSQFTAKKTQLPFSGNWSDLQYVNNMFIAGDLDSNRFVYSMDKGKTWEGGTLPFTGCIGFGSMEWGIVAFGANDYAYCIGDNFDIWYTGFPCLVVNGDPIPFIFYLP